MSHREQCHNYVEQLDRPIPCPRCRSKRCVSRWVGGKLMFHCFACAKSGDWRVTVLEVRVARKLDLEYWDRDVQSEERWAEANGAWDLLTESENPHVVFLARMALGDLTEREREAYEDWIDSDPNALDSVP